MLSMPLRKPPAYHKLRSFLNEIRVICPNNLTPLLHKYGGYSGTTEHRVSQTVAVENTNEAMRGIYIFRLVLNITVESFEVSFHQGTLPFVIAELNIGVVGEERTRNLTGNIFNVLVFTQPVPETFQPQNQCELDNLTPKNAIRLVKLSTWVNMHFPIQESILLERVLTISEI